MVMLVACEPCRQRKRKCDRGIPSCSLCTHRSRPCFYPPHRAIKEQDDSRVLSLSVLGQGSALWEMTASHLYDTWAIQSPDVPASYPVSPRWYMPRLIKHFCEGLGVSRLPVEANSTAYQIQTLWVQGALSDPCLFHATLYAGSSHFDLLRGEKPSSITLYHQSEAIRLLNKRLSSPVAAMDDRTLVAITPLALFADLNGDQAAADVHRAGLWKLVEMKGGLDKLGYDGLTSALVQMNTIIYNIAFDLEPGPTFPQPLETPPLGIEERILNISPSDSAYLATLPFIQNIFHDIHNFKVDFTAHADTSIDQLCYNHLQRYATAIPKEAFEDAPYYCCYLAVFIFRTIVDPQSRSPGYFTKLDALASELKASLALTDAELWIRRIPAVFTWVCLTGAAAASDSRARTWFYFQQASAVRVLTVRSGGPPFLDDLWAHFRWLRTLRLNLPTRCVVAD
ncbi:hypothetical protein BDW59DRAFT_65377 [Aspergillus cavernicola]|uniref:Zn(2)-C6 fungal-type domain-containing protein n=1 Tax=Aspergillus cavernicola TaxID=176166 RepID=A0ABR4IFC1_9EURO